MNYFQQIAERLLQPGTFLLVLGAILVYTSGIVARKLFSGSEKANIITKIVGCGVALVGAILIFCMILFPDSPVLTVNRI